MTYPRTVTIEKAVGETPLSALERYRSTNSALTGLPIAYAGRLDPMASGKLLLLLGEECKAQAQYHTLDKAYEFSVLFGITSDTADILGRLTFADPPLLDHNMISQATAAYRGRISLPYPTFSAKTVHGKPLHTWTLEGRLNEITIPRRHSRVYRLYISHIDQVSGAKIYTRAHAKIQALPPVTDPKKALGEDFRRNSVLADWEAFRAQYHSTYFPIVTIRCVASSGTYMRTLAQEIATYCGSQGLAFHITRTKIGRYRPLVGPFGIWTTSY
jgi:tRNA pseudouridine55 synthase